jgi:hypothetical protein
MGYRVDVENRVFSKCKYSQFDKEWRMGTFSIWHWIIVLGIFGIPALAVWLEKSDVSLKRHQFLLRLIGVVVAAAIVGYVTGYLVSPADYAQAQGLLSILTWVLWDIFFYRWLVQRARDAGMGKAIAYWAIVPVVNVVVLLILLFKFSVDGKHNAEIETKAPWPAPPSS